MRRESPANHSNFAQTGEKISAFVLQTPLRIFLSMIIIQRTEDNGKH
jgi:hypothetical protein